MAIADLVKSTLGPKGMDKILQSTGRGHNITVTNDGATILKSLHVDNPAAKVLVGEKSIMHTAILIDCGFLKYLREDIMVVAISSRCDSSAVDVFPRCAIWQIFLKCKMMR